MRFPNKLFPLKESTIVFFPVILEYLNMEKEKTIYELYKNTIDSFPSSTEWMETIICLYAIQAIDLDKEKGVVKYAM